MVSVLLNKNQNGEYYEFAEGVTDTLQQCEGEWAAPARGLARIIAGLGYV